MRNGSLEFRSGLCGLGGTTCQLQRVSACQPRIERQVGVFHRQRASQATVEVAHGRVMLPDERPRDSPLRVRAGQPSCVHDRALARAEFARLTVVASASSPAETCHGVVPSLHVVFEGPKDIAALSVVPRELCGDGRRVPDVERHQALRHLPVKVRTPAFAHRRVHDVLVHGVREPKSRAPCPVRVSLRADGSDEAGPAHLIEAVLEILGIRREECREHRGRELLPSTLACRSNC